MGKGTVQEKAISEVANLPASSPYKGNALDLFLSLKLELESKQNIEPEERNLAMRLSALYIEKIQEAQQIGRAEGIQEGRTEGERELVMLLLTEKLGDVSAQVSEEIVGLSLDKLQELARALLRFGSMTDLTQWLANHR
jgi:predicted transposase YdaD